MTTRFVSSIFKYSTQCLCSRNYANIGVTRYEYQKSNVIRPYSQQSAKEIEQKPTVPKIKSRTRRNPIRVGESVEKSGFWNVVAVATSEEYDLGSMLKALVKNENYRPSNKFESIYTTGTNLDFLHAMASHKIDKEDRELFIFRQGSFVAWNVSDDEVDNILDFVKEFEMNPYEQSIIRNEIEVMPYTYSINNNKSSLLHNGNICLTQNQEKHPLDKYTCSNGMVLSVKLGVWESLLDEFIDSIEHFTMDLKRGHRIAISRKDLLKKSGELYALKHKINLSSDLLDVPDFYWEREELENLYLNTTRYFSIPRRTKVINDKIHHCMELTELLSSHLSDRHHIRLEWMIILLIMVEVVFEGVHFAQQYRQPMYEDSQISE